MSSPSGIDLVQNAIDATTLQQQIAGLRYQLAHTRLSEYRVRRNLLYRLRIAEQKYAALSSRVLSTEGAHTASLYRPAVSFNKAGLLVILELSLDGTYYSNPAPVVPANAKVWVRAAIDEAHHGDSGVPKTHDMFRLRWTPGKGYTALDSVPRTGHDVYAVCWPLIITRKFRAPSSHTKQNWLLDVYPYERLDD